MDDKEEREGCSGCLSNIVGIIIWIVIISLVYRACSGGDAEKTDTSDTSDYTSTSAVASESVPSAEPAASEEGTVSAVPDGTPLDVSIILDYKMALITSGYPMYLYIDDLLLGWQNVDQEKIYSVRLGTGEHQFSMKPEDGSYTSDPVSFEVSAEETVFRFEAKADSDVGTKVKQKSAKAVTSDAEYPENAQDFCLAAVDGYELHTALASKFQEEGVLESLDIKTFDYGTEITYYPITGIGFEIRAEMIPNDQSASSYLSDGVEAQLDTNVFYNEKFHELKESLVMSNAEYKLIKPDLVVQKHGDTTWHTCTFSDSMNVKDEEISMDVEMETGVYACRVSNTLSAVVTYKWSTFKEGTKMPEDLQELVGGIISAVDRHAFKNDVDTLLSTLEIRP